MTILSREKFARNEKYFPSLSLPLSLPLSRLRKRTVDAMNNYRRLIKTSFRRERRLYSRGTIYLQSSIFLTFKVRQLRRQAASLASFFSSARTQLPVTTARSGARNSYISFLPSPCSASKKRDTCFCGALSLIRARTNQQRPRLRHRSINNARCELVATSAV